MCLTGTVMDVNPFTLLADLIMHTTTIALLSATDHVLHLKFG